MTYPQPHPAYQIAKPRTIQLRGREVVEIDGGQWLGLLETCAYFIREKKSDRATAAPKNRQRVKRIA